MKKSGIILIGVVGSLLFGTSVYAESYAGVKVDVLNVRQGPKAEAAIIDRYSKNDTVKIIEQVSSDWYAIENKNGKTAYVSSQHVEVFKVKAKINAGSVNSRIYPTADAKVNRQLAKGQDISVFYKVGDWYYTGLGNTETYGFVHYSYIESDDLHLLPEKDISQVKEIAIEEKTPKLTKGQELANYATQFVGNPYRYGGTSLTKGADCSGFTQQVMKQAGVSLQRSSSAQYAKNGVKVSTNDLQPGDLLFYGYGGRVSHVGVYIGNKKMVNASNAKTGIIISNAFRTSGKPLIGAKRVI